MTTKTEAIKYLGFIFEAFEAHCDLHNIDPPEDYEKILINGWRKDIEKALNIAEPVNKHNLKIMANAYEEERAKYVGGVVYYPNNQAAFEGAMLKAIDAQIKACDVPKIDGLGKAIDTINQEGSLDGLHRAYCDDVWTLLEAATAYHKLTGGE